MTRALAAVGALAIALGLVGLFTALGGRPAETWTAGRAPAVGTADFRQALAGAVGSPVQRGGRAEILINGDEFLPALLAEIDAAQHSIDFMAYVWRPGEMSDRLLARLEAAARRGVEVRLMLDGFGASEMDDAAFAPLEEAGAKIVVFRPLRPTTLTRFHRRNHRRAIVMDGQVAFTGGAAVADTWLGDAEDVDHWRDDLVRVTGPLARSVQAAFAQLWADTSGEILVGPRFFPSTEPAGAGQDIHRHVALASSPSHEYHPLRRLFFLSFAGARERIWITNPYVVPDPEVLEVLCEQAREGVDVRILTSSQHTDLAVVRWASQHYYETMLEAGVRIWEYQPTLHHSKTLIVDDVWAVVGSPNLDVRSKQLNEENVLGIEDPGFVESLERVFLEDLERSEEVRLEEWRERPHWKRWREHAAALLEEQL